jgi:5-methylcytosine-specific restriction protein A
MARRPLRPCAFPRCRTLVRDGTYCAAHAAPATDDRPSAAARGYGHRWRKLRSVILRRDPICRACGRAASTDVDHVVPRSAGGTDEAENLQGLCHACHSRKTAVSDRRWRRAKTGGPNFLPDARPGPAAQPRAFLRENQGGGVRPRTWGDP